MAAGELYINNTDAYTAWGVSLEDGGLDALMAFRPNKEPVTNKNVTSNGAVVVSGTAGLVDDRTVSVPMHIVASSKSDFLSKKSAFYAAIKNGALTIQTTAETYTMYYVSCSQYTQFLSGMAKFILTLYEPNNA